jgi:hypothetical protein
MFRIFVSLMLVIFAVLAFGAGTFFEMSRSETIAFNRLMQARLDATATDVLAFQRATKRLPEPDEFERLVDRTPIAAVSSGLLGPSFGPHLLLDEEIRNCGGSVQELVLLKKATFVLGIWNGDWLECFAPSPRVSTLALAAADFPKSKSVLVARMIALLLLASAGFVMMQFRFKRKHV